MAAAALTPPLADLFVTNLRLLDLDKRLDWPDIDPKTFSSKDVLGQNQKARIRCCEWALYRLFEIWDPEDTKDKLQPFFPPLEPLQSLNLRAALFRCLNDLKKNGLLGRETVLRKTMLDECKGEKFFEVLVLFSTAVVTKFAVPRITEGATPSVALTLATATTLNASQQRSLIPLAIAHRSSLNALLKKKADAYARCQQFYQLLRQKNQNLNDRVRKCHAANPPVMDPEEAKQIEQEVYTNWPGKSQWPRALLYGDDTHPGDAPLKRPFNSVWGAVISVGTMEHEDEPLGLIASLEQRVSDQKERLRTWRAFHQEILKESPRARNLGRPRAGSTATFHFTKHLDLHLNSKRSSQDSFASSRPSRVTNSQFSAIIMDMKQELEDLDKPKPSKDFRRNIAPSHNPHDFLADKPHLPPTNSYDSWNNRPPNRMLTGSFVTGSSTAVPLSRIFSPAKSFRLSRATSSSSHPTRSNSAESSTPSLVDRSEPTPPPTPKVVRQDDDEGTSNGAVEYAPEPPDPDLADQLADDPISSALNPPRIEILSLAERTRRSMMLASGPGQGGPVSLPQLSSKEATSAASVIATGPPVADRRASLLERTQASMAHLSVHHKPRKSVSHKRQSIASFPVNQFETPGRPRPQPMRDATPTEKLFSEDADYASVFKSRPRVAVSPGPSPADGADEGLENDIIEEEGEESFYEGESWIGSSPLRGRG